MPIVWTFPDGTVKVTTVVEPLQGDTVAAVTQHAEKMKLDPLFAGAEFVLIKSANMPTDRANRANWKVEGNKVVDK